MNMEKFIHMQRYYKTIAIMLICSLLLTGCTTRNSGQEDDAEVKTSYEFNADKSQVSEKSRSSGDGLQRLHPAFQRPEALLPAGAHL